MLENLPPTARTYPRPPWLYDDPRLAHLVSFDLKNISVFDAIHKAANVLKLEVEAKRDSITVRPRKDGTSIVELLPAPFFEFPERPAIPAPLGSQAKKASTLIIPQIQMQSVSVKEALDWTRQKSIELDPSKKGIALVLRSASAPSGDDRRMSVLISLRGVSVWELIHYIALFEQLEVSATDEAIIVHPERKKPVAATIASASTADDQAALARKLTIPRIKMYGASVGETLAFVQRKSIEVDPGKRGVNLIFKDLPPTAKDYRTAPVTFDLINVSVWEVIERAANVGKLEVIATKAEITVRPKGGKPRERNACGCTEPLLTSRHLYLDSPSADEALTPCSAVAELDLGGSRSLFTRNQNQSKLDTS